MDVVKRRKILVKLANLMKEYIKLFDQFQPLEEEKLQAAETENLVKLEQCINKEQAFTLALRGIENKREKMLKENGQQGMTLKEIIDKFYQDQKNELLEIYDEMNRKMKVFKSTNDSAMAIVNARLRNIDNTIKVSQQIYNQNGDFEGGEHHLTNIKV